MKKFFLIFIFLGLITRGIFSGDIAIFKNLGFSDDSKYFMFVQYGVNEKKSTPYANMFMVFVPDNVFANEGVKKFEGTGIIEPGDNGDGAFYKILEDNISLTRKFNIDHLSKGRILYLLVNGQTPKEHIEFRDFHSGSKYQINLVQTAEGSGKNIKSSFYIDLTVSLPSGSTINRKVGHATYKRQGVKSYNIRQILVAPDNKSVIFIIEREEVDTTGDNIRYMVETAVINGG